jgi:HK97 family phage portal protein
MSQLSRADIALLKGFIDGTPPAGTAPATTDFTAPQTRGQINDNTLDGLIWGDQLWSMPTASGIAINQQTALNSAAVMACVTMIAEDTAKLPIALFRRLPSGGRLRVKPKEHWLAQLLRRPNSWQNWLEFCEMLQIGLLMRGNGYAVMLRNGRGIPQQLVPINPDHVALWEAQDGSLFYKVTPFGLHELAILRDQPPLIPYEDMFHLRGFSVNGLLGASRIALAREAIGLSLAQERQAAQWMGAGARPSGVLTTDQKLTQESANRIRESWKNLHSGLANSGRTAILEAGLKWAPLSMTSADLEFIGSRQFQLQDIARIWRVPPHKIGELSRATNNNITQQSQEYVNDTISSYTTRWKRKFDDKFDLDDDDLFIDFDLGDILRGDIVARYNAYRTGIMSMFLTPDECRLDDGRDPMGGRAAELQFALNTGTQGSHATGEAGDGGGRPEDGEVSPKNNNAIEPAPRRPRKRRAAA